MLERLKWISWIKHSKCFSFIFRKQKLRCISNIAKQLWRALTSRLKENHLLDHRQILLFMWVKSCFSYGSAANASLFWRYSSCRLRLETKKPCFTEVNMHWLTNHSFVRKIMRYEGVHYNCFKKWIFFLLYISNTGYHFPKNLYMKPSNLITYSYLKTYWIWERV